LTALLLPARLPAGHARPAADGKSRTRGGGALAFDDLQATSFAQRYRLVRLP
jgi:hypothetical protein